MSLTLLQTTNDFPVGYGAVVLALGLTPSTFYTLYSPTDDSLLGSGVPCAGGYANQSDVSSGLHTFHTNTLGYDWFQYASATVQTDYWLVHNPTVTPNAQKAPAVSCTPGPGTRVYPPDVWRIGGPTDCPVNWHTGGLGPAMANAGVLSITPIGGTGATLNWTAGTLDATAGTLTYKLHRGTSSPPGPVIFGPSTALTFTDSGLTPGTTYYYQVEAGIDLGSGEFIHGTGAGATSIAYLSNIVNNTGLILKEQWGAAIL